MSYAVIAASALMLVFWLRFTLRLLVFAKPPADPAHLVSKHRLSHAALRLDPHQAHADELLERDYQILLSLLAQVPTEKLELLVMRADFRILRIWSLLVRPFSPALFNGARSEMVAILENFSGRTAAHSSLLD